MEFTVYTSAGGFRDFTGESTFNVGEQNGVLYVWEDGTEQVIVYGASAWSSVQEKKRMDAPVATGRRRLAPVDDDPTEDFEPSEDLADPDLTASEVDELSVVSELYDDELEPRPLFERGPVFQPKHA